MVSDGGHVLRLPIQVRDAIVRTMIYYSGTRSSMGGAMASQAEKLAVKCDVEQPVERADEHRQGRALTMGNAS